MRSPRWSAFICAGLACTAVYTQLMAHVTQGFLHKLRTRMFAGMQKLPIRYFDHEQPRRYHELLHE